MIRARAQRRAATGAHGSCIRYDGELHPARRLPVTTMLGCWNRHGQMLKLRLTFAATIWPRCWNRGLGCYKAWRRCYDHDSGRRCDRQWCPCGEICGGAVGQAVLRQCGEHRMRDVCGGEGDFQGRSWRSPLLSFSVRVDTFLLEALE